MLIVGVTIELHDAMSVLHAAGFPLSKSQVPPLELLDDPLLEPELLELEPPELLLLDAPPPVLELLEPPLDEPALLELPEPEPLLELEPPVLEPLDELLLPELEPLLEPELPLEPLLLPEPTFTQRSLKHERPALQVPFG